MKKKYSKPRIIIEDFAIAQNIAQNCGYAGGNQYTHSNPDGGCVWKYGDTTVFSTSACNFPLKPGLGFDDLCYNNPEGKTAVFGSY
ncbi:MAG: hypothetical protein ACLSWP_00850 [Terrisporobacter sp.]|uniref:hypothetical protein n=1 Tax=Terrisporobacter sp. TaxID=1965305 RepID=UPI00399565E7